MLNTLLPPINSTDASGLVNTADTDDTEDELAAVSSNPLEEEGNEKQGLLFIVLTLVFMMGDIVEEGLNVVSYTIILYYISLMIDHR